MCESDPYLQHPLRQTRLLRQLLQILGVRILVDGKVRFHRSQLMVLKGRSHSFRPRMRRWRVHSHAMTEAVQMTAAATAAAAAAAADSGAGRLAAIVGQVE